MGVESKQYVRIEPKPVRIVRRLSLAVNTLVPIEVLRQPNDGLSRLEELAKNGYGSLIIFNHLSKGDVPRSIATAFKNTVLGKREILLSQAIHQHRRWHGPIGRAIGVTFCPIVTGDTKQLVEERPSAAKKFKEDITREGTAHHLREYVDKGLDVLGSGGVVIMFPQAGRRSSLTTISDSVEALLNRSKRPHTYIEKIAIIFLGLDIKGEQDYEKCVDRVNLFKTYQVIVGEAMTREELFEAATKNNQGINDVVLEKMRKVVPPTYLPQTVLKE